MTNEELDIAAEDPARESWWESWVISDPCESGETGEYSAFCAGWDSRGKHDKSESHARESSVVRKSSTCVWLRDGTKATIKRDGMKAWLDVVKTSTVELAKLKEEPKEVTP